MTTMPEAVQIQPTLSDLPPDARGMGGLIARARAGEIALPLAAVRVRATIAGDCCRTVVDQRFRNTLDRPMEAIHIFPLPEDGAVTEVELHCGELIVKAECKEKQQAEKEFSRARDAGHRAALLTAERDDVHTLRVTNLPAGEEVTVRMVIVERLDSVDGKFRWRFPTTIAPRYLPGEEFGHGGPGGLPDTTAVPDASRLQPPLRLEGGTRLDLEVTLSGALTEIESSLHAVRMTIGNGVRIAPSSTATCNRDFVLAFSTAADESAAARAYTDGAHTVITVEPPGIALAEALPRDAVFVIDISGSMQGTKLQAAKRALQAALHGLMPGDRFQLIAFDTDLELFANRLSDYNERTLVRADRWIDALQARGGTLMLPAVQAALDGKAQTGRIRTVLFITDGEAWNEDELVAAVANRRDTTRFFTLGIDTAVNAALLKKLADVGGGTCELATPEDDIETLIGNIETRFGGPLVEELTVEGHTPARLRKEVLFNARPASLIIEGAPEVVTITGRDAAGEFRVEARPERVDFPLGALWGRARVAGLEERLRLKPFEEEALKPEILRVALKYSIASRFTAFIAIERSHTTDGRLVEVVQPAELPQDWQRHELAAPRLERTMLKRRAKSMRRPASVKGLDLFPGSILRDAGPDESLFGIVPEPDYCRVVDGVGEAYEHGLPHSDPGADLARAQRADGSFDGDVAKTAAALIALVLLGHTRRKGNRRRVVLKAARWLAAHAGDPLADEALALLREAETGEPVGHPGTPQDLAERALA